MIRNTWAYIRMWKNLIAMIITHSNIVITLCKELNLFDKNLHERNSCLQIKICTEIYKGENESQINSWIYNNEI